jgi:hypothetical protein
VTTVPAEALAKAGQLTIVRVSLSGFVIERQTPIFKHFSPDLEINLSGFLSEKSK